MRSCKQNYDQIGSAGLSSRITGLAVGLVFAVVLAACGGGGSTNGDSGKPVLNTDPIVVDVEMADNVFIPVAITVAVGQQVEFALTNTGAAIHNMRIADTEFKSEAVINPGATSSFTAKFTKAGSYTYVCDYHVPGMVGTITVEG